MTRLLHPLLSSAAIFGCFSLSACSEPEPLQPTRYEDLKPGRYAIIPVAGTREMIQLDTGSGKTWRLTWSEDAEGAAFPTGWISLDGPSRPLAAQ